MDREEMIRTLADARCGDKPNPCGFCDDSVRQTLRAIDTVFGEGWFIGTPTDRSETTLRLHLFNDTTRERIDELNVDDPDSIVFGWDATHVLVALNGTESAAGSEATENKP